MANSGPISNNLMLYQTLLKSISNTQNDHFKKPNLSNELFGQLLEHSLLRLESYNEDEGFRSSLLTHLTPVNFTEVGIGAAILGRETSILNQLPVYEIEKMDGSLSNVNGSLHFQEVDMNSLNSHLKGALSGAGSLFIEAGKKYQLNPAFLASVAIHETGNGSSNAARFKNNVAGMMGKNGLKSYGSIEESIFDMARNLRENYLNEGRTTVAEIGAKYAPIGAANDPTGLNNHWVNGVQKYLNQLTKTDF
jgi:hypothetical protein